MFFCFLPREATAVCEWFSLQQWLWLLTKRREGAHRAGVSAALSTGLTTAALTHTRPRYTTTPR